MATQATPHQQPSLPLQVDGNKKWFCGRCNRSGDVAYSNRENILVVYGRAISLHRKANPKCYAVNKNWGIKVVPVTGDWERGAA